MSREGSIIRLGSYMRYRLPFFIYKKSLMDQKRSESNYHQLNLYYYRLFGGIP